MTPRETFALSFRAFEVMTLPERQKVREAFARGDAAASVIDRFYQAVWTVAKAAMPGREIMH